MTRKCPRCGKQSSGKFCAECGAPLDSRKTEFCGDCGEKLAANAAFCSECGKPVGARPKKPTSAYLPWVVTSFALIVFIVAITYFVRQQAGPRGPDDPPSGGVIRSPGEAAGSAMGGVDLASMSPREAADRLFDRTMREAEAGGSDRVDFFADMALQAYGGLPPDQIDLDVRFHRGLLHLQLENFDAARGEAEVILSGEPDHLLGLILAARTAEQAGDEAAAADYRARFTAVYPDVDLSTRPEYVAHQRLLEGEASGLAD